VKNLIYINRCEQLNSDICFQFPTILGICELTTLGTEEKPARVDLDMGAAGLGRRKQEPYPAEPTWELSSWRWKRTNFNFLMSPKPAVVLTWNGSHALLSLLFQMKKHMSRDPEEKRMIWKRFGLYFIYTPDVVIYGSVERNGYMWCLFCPFSPTSLFVSYTSHKSFNWSLLFFIKMHGWQELQTNHTNSNFGYKHCIDYFSTPR
jgi:hypothetical protein